MLEGINNAARNAAYVTCATVQHTADFLGNTAIRVGILASTALMFDSAFYTRAPWAFALGCDAPTPIASMILKSDMTCANFSKNEKEIHARQILLTAALYLGTFSVSAASYKVRDLAAELKGRFS